MALANAYYRNIFRGTSAQISDESSPENNYMANEEGENSEKALKFFAMSQSSSISSPSSTNSSGYKPNLQLEETHSVIDFKNGYNNFVHGVGASGSLLNFEQHEQSPPNLSQKMSHNEHPFWEDLNCVQSSSNSYGFINNTKESPQEDEVPFGWTSSENNVGSKELQSQELASFNKRPLTGESTQALKRQCNSSATKKQQLKPKTTPSKDPQSVAAKNRRERISERLKVLQELIPNGSKVDLVTMLEKAIGYVKFLQLQVKVLAADEFWPAQGGRAPDLSQVKEALDAILSTQRERKSSSK